MPLPSLSGLNLGPSTGPIVRFQDPRAAARDEVLQREGRQTRRRVSEELERQGPDQCPGSFDDLVPGQSVYQFPERAVAFTLEFIHAYWVRRVLEGKGRDAFNNPCEPHSPAVSYTELEKVADALGPGWELSNAVRVVIDRLKREDGPVPAGADWRAASARRDFVRTAVFVQEVPARGFCPAVRAVFEELRTPSEGRVYTDTDWVERLMQAFPEAHIRSAARAYARAQLINQTVDPLFRAELNHPPEQSHPPTNEWEWEFLFGWSSRTIGDWEGMMAWVAAHLQRPGGRPDPQALAAVHFEQRVLALVANLRGREDRGPVTGEQYHTAAAIAGDDPFRVDGTSPGAYERTDRDVQFGERFTLADLVAARDAPGYRGRLGLGIADVMDVRCLDPEGTMAAHTRHAERDGLDARFSPIGSSVHFEWTRGEGGPAAANHNFFTIVVTSKPGSRLERMIRNFEPELTRYDLLSHLSYAVGHSRAMIPAELNSMLARAAQDFPHEWHDVVDWSIVTDDPTAGWPGEAGQRTVWRIKIAVWLMRRILQDQPFASTANYDYGAEWGLDGRPERPTAEWGNWASPEWTAQTPPPTEINLDGSPRFQDWPFVRMVTTGTLMLQSVFAQVYARARTQGISSSKMGFVDPGETRIATAWEPAVRNNVVQFAFERMGPTRDRTLVEKARAITGTNGQAETISDWYWPGAIQRPPNVVYESRTILGGRNAQLGLETIPNPDRLNAAAVLQGHLRAGIGLPQIAIDTYHRREFGRSSWHGGGQRFCTATLQAQMWYVEYLRR